MEPKKIALLVGAVVVALVTALLARQMFVKSATPVAVAAPIQSMIQPTGPKVLVATRALPVGTILDDSSFKYQPWPKDLIQGAYYVEGKDKGGIENLRGAVVRNAISAGQPIVLGSVVQPGDRGFLAAALGPGMRAITVAVRAETSVAGFVFPGDRVDLMLTQTVDGGGAGGPPLKTTETIMRNLRVLATDQRTTGEDEKGNKEVKQFQTVTLEVTPRIGEKIAVAQTIGMLSLSLRPIADDTTQLERAIASGAVNVPKDGDVAAERRMAIQLAQQPSDAGPTFVTGADVSRFQRRSAPATGPVAQRPVERVAAGGIVQVQKGPVVRVARGNSVTEVPIGGK